MPARQLPNDTDDDQRTVPNDEYEDADTTIDDSGADTDLDELEFDADDEDVIDEDEAEYADDEADTTWEDDTETDPQENPDEDNDDETEEDADDKDDSEDGDELDFLDEDLDWDEDPGADGFNEEIDTLENDPEKLRQMLDKSRRENAARRKKYNEFRDQSVEAIEQGVASFLGQVADQIGLSVEDPSDADAIVTAVNELVEGSNKQRSRAERDLAIYRAAIPAGADMSKLADSKSFTATVDALDPTSETFSADVAEALAATLEANPHFKTAQKIDRSGGDFTSGIPANAPADDSVEALRQKRQQRAGR